MTSANDTHAMNSDNRTTVDNMAGILAAASLVLSALALFRAPALLAPVGTIVAFTAARMSPRTEKLALFSVVVNIICFIVGMTLAVITEHSLL
jgi:hypothetical protein